MQLNHLNLMVTDVPATAALLSEYFNLRPLNGFPGNDKMAFLEDDGGFMLSLFRGKEVSYPSIFHIGFIQETLEQVKDLHQRLTVAGFKPQEMREEHGRLTFYFKSGTGILIEVNCFLNRPAT